MKWTIYSQANCPGCMQAKALLEAAGVPFEVIDLTGKRDELMALVARTGLRTMPQIMRGDEVIGGIAALQLAVQGKMASLRPASSC